MSSIIVGSLVGVLAVGGTFAAKANAQDGPGVVFSIPFSFTADGRNIAAGTYELNLVSNKFMMSIRNVRTGDMQVFSVHPEEQRATESEARLIFHNCGGHLNLTEFHVPGTNLFSETMPPRGVKNMEAKVCPATDFVTLASR
ncbi:hypothetical protein P8935_02810 [Telmatobacter sp. DSM 110680]|uniref:DUF2846 domain-containing protein n=1 Tax=Telmatobacter sp. DSM 110680 TaxID=3036704 RepID=A0AAU7DLS8_9BACT